VAQVYTVNEMRRKETICKHPFASFADDTSWDFQSSTLNYPISSQNAQKSTLAHIPTYDSDAIYETECRPSVIKLRTTATARRLSVNNNMEEIL